MEAYVLGDRDAFAELFKRLAPRVHRFFRRVFLTEATADDLLQQTFLKLHHARSTYKPKMKVAVWAFAIAANVRLDEHRKRKRVTDDGGENVLTWADDSSAPVAPLGVMRADAAEGVLRAVASLPESQKVVIHLHRFEDLSFAEISHVMGTTEGAVKLCASQAYGTLRTLLSSSLVDAGAV